MGDRIDMGRKLGGTVPLWGRGTGFPSNTMWPGPRPICLPSFILIHPTVCPQYTNVADRQTDRQLSDSIGRTVLQTVAQLEALAKARPDSSKKVKASHTRYRALGPELIPVYRQSARR